MTQVLLVTCLFFWVFAILGMSLFMGKFDFCNDASVSGKDTCVGSFQNQNTGEYVNRQWLQPNAHFDNIFRSFLTLIQLASGESWVRVMRRGIDSTGAHPDNLLLQDPVHPCSGHVHVVHRFPAGQWTSFQSC